MLKKLLMILTFLMLSTISGCQVYYTGIVFNKTSDEIYITKRKDKFWGLIGTIPSVLHCIPRGNIQEKSLDCHEIFAE